MTGRHIHANRAVFSATNVREALATALSEIKDQDGLTDADLGAVLGKSPDRAREYRLATATMDAETFGRGKREWNGRFTGLFDRLCVESRPGKVNDHGSLTAVLNAAACLSRALENGEIEVHEVRDNRAELEAAYDALGAQLGKLMATIALSPIVASGPSSLTIDLPLPPSTNELTVNLKGGGRAKSAKYKAWIEEARWHVMMAWRNAGKPTWTEGPMSLLLELGIEGRVRDAGNCLKAVEDLLVKNLPVPDDRWNDRILIERSEDISGFARVTIEPLEPD